MRAERKTLLALLAIASIGAISIALCALHVVAISVSDLSGKPIHLFLLGEQQFSALFKRPEPNTSDEPVWYSLYYSGGVLRLHGEDLPFCWVGVQKTWLLHII